MKKKSKFILTLILVAVITSACAKTDVKEYSVFKQGDIQSKFKTNGNKIEVYNDESWMPITIKSVTLDYFFPNIDVPDEEYFYNQIEMIADMQANTIKLNDLFPPTFYDSLLKYNTTHNEPLYLIQSVKMDTTSLNENPDPFKLDNLVPYNNKISTYISAIHGDVTIPTREDNARIYGGKYTSDVSKYTLSYILGADWNPEIINSTNANRLDKEDVNSIFFETIDARPFEVFIANFLEHTVGYERDKYKFNTPISLLNSPKTDTIDQAYNSDPMDNLASINPSVIKPKKDVSFFVSYELFPYEPDFLNLNPKYTKFIDHRGNTNNYAGYLNDLIPTHEVPVFISEFGIPSSRGISKISTSNKNKGKNSEKDQGEIISSMFEDIVYQGAIGGSINSWQDNWSKNNNISWLDRQNPDSNFGLISYDSEFDFFKANYKDLKNYNNDEAIFSSDKKDENIIESVYINNDHKNIYFNIKYKKLNDINNLKTNIFISTLLDQGSISNNINKYKTKLPSNFLINLDFNSPNNSKMYIHSYYDLFNYKYGQIEQFIETNEEFSNKENNIFNPINTLISRPYIDSVTGNTLPLLSYETGQLYGDIIADDTIVDSIYDYVFIEKDNLLKIKIPWSLLNFTNPSIKEVLGDFRVSEDIDIRTNVNSVNLSILTYENEELPYSIGSIENDTLSTSIPYQWGNWNINDLNIRKKDSYDIMKKTFSNY